MLQNVIFGLLVCASLVDYALIRAQVQDDDEFSLLRQTLGFQKGEEVEKEGGLVWGVMANLMKFITRTAKTASNPHIIPRLCTPQPSTTQ